MAAEARRCDGIDILMYHQVGGKNQTNQQRGKQHLWTGAAFKRLWQQMHKGCGQQRASSQAEQVLGANAVPLAAQTGAHQQRSQPHAANTRRQRSE